MWCRLWKAYPYFCVNVTLLWHGTKSSRCRWNNPAAEIFKSSARQQKTSLSLHMYFNYLHELQLVRRALCDHVQITLLIYSNVWRNGNAYGHCRTLKISSIIISLINREKILTSILGSNFRQMRSHFSAAEFGQSNLI